MGVLLLAACAPDSPAEPAIGPIPVVRSGTDIVLPLDSYVQTGPQMRLLTKAMTVAGNRCMRRFGLEWPADESIPEFSNARRYGILDAATGYHDGAEAIPRPLLSKSTTDVWLGEGRTEYNGQPVPRGGCAGEALRKLKPGIEKIKAGLPQKLQWQSHGMTKQDSRVAEVFTRWSSCMRARGFDYRDPSAAAGDQRWRTGQAGAAEIATAVADVACKKETNTAGVMLAVETAYQQGLIAGHAADLTAVMAYAEKELQIAHQVIAEG